MECQRARSRIFLPPSVNVLHDVLDDGAIVALPYDPLPVDPEEVTKGVAATVNGWLALPADGGRQVLVVHVAANRQLTLRRLPVPDGRLGTCCAIRGGWLFVATRGGEFCCDPPALHAMDLVGSTADWTDIPIPNDAICDRREFDDLMIVGDQLVALDNLLFEKQLFRFDISSLPQTELISNDVFFSGSYAEADRIVCGITWAAAKCSTAFDMGCSDDIVLWSLPDWHKVGEINQSGSMVRRMAGDPAMKANVFRSPWARIEAMGSLLLFETFDGLGALDVAALFAAWRARAGATAAMHRDQFTALAAQHWSVIPSLGGSITALPDEGLLAIGGKVARAYTESDLKSQSVWAR